MGPYSPFFTPPKKFGSWIFSLLSIVRRVLWPLLQQFSRFVLFPLSAFCSYYCLVFTPSSQKLSISRTFLYHITFLAPIKVLLPSLLLRKPCFNNHCFCLNLDVDVNLDTIICSLRFLFVVFSPNLVQM